MSQLWLHDEGEEEKFFSAFASTVGKMRSSQYVVLFVLGVCAVVVSYFLCGELFCIIYRFRSFARTALSSE